MEPANAPTRTDTRQRARQLALLLGLSLVILSFNFGSRQLLTNDDTRFPVMARDVLSHGHWLLPALPDGRPHLAKPPLVVWLMSLASWPAGAVSARTAILPSLLEAVGVVLVLVIAVPWWIVAATADRERFVSGIVLYDQLLWYVPTTGRHWRAISEPIGHAVAITLPWCILLPVAVRAAIREAHAERSRYLRLLLVWLATVFAILAVSDQQRERYYLPLCPAVALLIGWWYSTLAWRRRVWAFAGAWITLVAIGAVIDTIHTRRFNEATDLAAVRAALENRSGPLYATDVPELALTFNLERPVLVSKSLRFFRDRVAPDGHLIIPDRALAGAPDQSCLRQLARGVLDRQPFTLVIQDGC